ncbi:hypothetical protein LSH36_79g08052 [Paralvinella palmiformis]|uniref:Uncharacterized protein n=1 Tax=Paralvinella palmiformis TaxID=53620 RepID=A0AAD9NCS7_9ANNE|nr:hypothetical protein LSH36_79g08052 [Paralvinella palmiformis]
MATRAATFTAKIRNLKDYYSRMINNITPLPAGMDIANTLKYFSQTLLCVLKDVPFIPSEVYTHRLRDNVRLSMFPSLNYSGLYEGVLNIIDVVPLVQHGQHVLGESILNVLGCLAPFLEYDLLDTLPYIVASALAVFPDALQSDVVDLLCTNLLPITLGYDSINEIPNYATESTPAVLMMVFQYVSNPEHHSQVLECLMSMKKNIAKDLLSIIAFGSPVAKAPAVNLLFYYWPQLYPPAVDRRSIHYQYSSWVPVSCQREKKKCPNSGNVRAIKVCLDPSIAIECGDRPPPLHACSDCCNILQKNDGCHFLLDLVQPHENISPVCENKNCRSTNREAACTCFAKECIRFNSNHPIRYCATCHQIKHENSEGISHVYHQSLPQIWNCDADIRHYITEAIISLLKEAQPLQEKRTVEMGEERIRGPHFDDEEGDDSEQGDDRKLLSRYGIWLLLKLCPVKEDVDVIVLGRIMAMLFQWYDATAYLPDGKQQTLLSHHHKTSVT